MTLTRGRVLVGLALAAIGLVAGAGVGPIAAAASQSGPGGGSGAAGAAGCDRGEFCLWQREWFRGTPETVTLQSVTPEQCHPLPDGVDARSFANRTTRPVTVYQGRDCDTEGEFHTYPGGGTYVPEAPYVVRGVQIWER